MFKYIYILPFSILFPYCSGKKIKTVYFRFDKLLNLKNKNKPFGTMNNQTLQVLDLFKYMGIATIIEITNNYKLSVNRIN
jgi:hypothetical protein